MIHVRMGKLCLLPESRPRGPHTRLQARDRGQLTQRVVMVFHASFSTTNRRLASSLSKSSFRSAQCSPYLPRGLTPYHRAHQRACSPLECSYPAARQTGCARWTAHSRPGSLGRCRYSWAHRLTEDEQRQQDDAALCDSVGSSGDSFPAGRACSATPGWSWNNH